jgi:hypothetical protein
MHIVNSAVLERWNTLAIDRFADGAREVFVLREVEPPEHG